MKTDKFNESIRRKLESVEPEFREEAWTRFQSKLSPSVAKPLWRQPLRWGLTAAAASVATVLLAGTVWLYRSNQQKTAAIRTLQEQVASLQKKAQAGSVPNEPATAAPLRQVDTVYITRYVENPVYIDAYGRRADKAEALAGREPLEESEPSAVPAESGADERTALERISSSVTPGTDLSGETSAGSPAAGSAPVGNRVAAGIRTNGRRTPSEPTGAFPAETGGTRRGPAAWPAKGSAYADRNAALRDNHPAADGPSGKVSEERTAASLTLEPLQSLPIRVDSAYFVERYARRSRRVRFQSALPTLSNPAVEEPVPLFQVRAGAGTELGIGGRSFGFSAEVLVGRYFVLGTGLNRARLTGDVFLTDNDFNRKTHRDFRRDYVPGIDPRHDITNIDRKSLLWQLPVNLGIRLPVGQDFVLTPTVGATFSLKACERITFTYRRGPGEFNQVITDFYRPNDWYNTWTFAMPIEKQWNQVALQAGPFVNVPFEKAPNGFNTLMGGIRARVLYRF